MAEYPKYDWRGIAMLTEQLGKLFEPSQMQLMSSKQKHDMNMLMAKQAWDTGIKQLDTLNTKYDKLVASNQTQTNAAIDLGLGDIARASAADGSMIGDAEEIYDKNEMRYITQLHKAEEELKNMIRTEKQTLDNLQSLNEHGKQGALWADTFEAKRDETREDVKVTDYREEADFDGSGTLSWEEQNSAIKHYISDYYMVPEGEEGMSINVGGETITGVTPEAHAFVAGFQHVRGRGKVETTERTKKASGEKGINTLNEWLNLDAAWMSLPDDDKKIVNNYMKSGSSARYKPAIPVHLKDALLQRQEMDKISVDIGKADLNDRIQILDDSYWGAPAKAAVDKFDFGTGVRDVPAVPADIKAWEEKGLDKAMYTNLRMMGAKSEKTRGALEYVIKNWDGMIPSERSMAVAKILNEYKSLIGL